MTEYILKSAVALSATYLLYFVFARKNANFKWLRIYFLTAILVSFAFPALKYLPNIHRQNLVSVSSTYIPNWIEGPSDVIVVPQDISTSSLPQNSKSKLLLSDVLKYFYLAGVLILLLRFIIGLTQLAWLVVKNRVRRIDKDYIVFVQRLSSPFSFFQLIFINQNDLTDVHKTCMLHHERVHVRQWHSVDLLLLDFITMVQWFNPFAWFIRRALKEIHEYMADEDTVKGQISPLDYLHLLLTQACGLKVYLPANGFNSSLTKKRILMITNNKRNRRWVTVFTILIVAIIAIDSLSRVNIAQNLPKTSKAELAKINAKAPLPPPPIKTTVKFTPPEITQTDIPRFKGTSNGRESFNAIMQYFSKNTKYPEIASGNNKVMGVVYVKFVVKETGKIENIECANDDPSFPENLKDGDRVKNSYVTNYGSFKTGAYLDFIQSSMNVTTDPALVSEAIRVVSTMPDFEPARDKDGKAIKKESYIIVPFNGNQFYKKLHEIDNYVNKNIIYPKEAMDSKVEGVIYVQFSFVENGKFGNVSIIPVAEIKHLYEKQKTSKKTIEEKTLSDNTYLQQEALRVLKSMPEYMANLEFLNSTIKGSCRINFYLPEKVSKK